MKNLFKFSILSLAIAGLSYSAQAQNTTTSTPSTRTSKAVRFSIGPDAGFPVGSLSNTHNWNLGGSIQADFPVATGLDVTANAGFNNFFGKDYKIGPIDAKYNDINLIPVKVGLKYFPVENFYVQGEAGASFIANKNNIGANQSAAFTYAPQIGVLFPVGDKNYIDAGIRYESNTKFTTNGNSNNFFGIRVAYAFDLK
ncbi:outer membrane beta-barrel protein [Mucilaginibacter arboris]|uniref:Outer membrane beta-barrel protein n=1 Tax=Mucilaginibacter arboris TaxID=2682090 RepID=A0A7K1SS43_9SPHI|nr:outer membrane beta-barrel protein [Mucilaginibacter arboris]MVN20131.1 outer membrane beta-barrel protein [Mucilaginibacter arboris]